MKSNWYKNFKSKFKVVIIHPETYEEKGGFNMSQMRFTNLVIIYSLIIIAITTCIIFFTSVRELIPGYTDVSLPRRIYNLEQRADSLTVVMHQKDLFINNLKRIIEGEDVDISIKKTTTPTSSSTQNVTVKYTMPTFFVPVSGYVTKHFNSKENHYGVDVVTKPDAIVKATAKGTVIFSDWSAESGYVIGIQHDMNMVSIHKHNASLLHHQGDVVNAGDAIAIIGGGGSTSTGPHLHFELWLDEKALNPEDYISFEGK